MKILSRIIISFLIVIIQHAATAQVAVNPTGSAPDPNAMLDVSSTNKGFLPPRLTTAQRDAIGGIIPAGLTIYNTDENCTNVYNGAAWQSICGGGATSDMTYLLTLNKSIITVGLPDTSDADPQFINLHRTGGTPSQVLLELSGVPSGVSYSMSPGGGLPDVTSTLIFYTSLSAVAGSYTITVNATGGVANASASFTLEIVGVKRVFLSDDTGLGGNMGGLSGADAICQSQANGAALGGTWVAWLSTSGVHAKDRISNGIFKRLDGVILAYNKADLLDGILLASPRMTASGEYTGAWARTGTNSDGTANANTCNNWTSNSGNTPAGDPDSYSSSGWWTNRQDVACTAGYRIFCFEQ